MRRRNLAALVFAPLLLAACTATDLTTPQEVAVACRGYASTLFALTPFKSRMTDAQIGFVDRANATVIPACAAAAEGEDQATDDVLRLVRDQLRQMLLLEQSLKENA